MDYKNDLAIIIVNRDRPDLTDALFENLNNINSKNGKDIFIIEMGSQKKNLSKYYSYYYEDNEFSGKAFGHNQGLKYVLENHGRYRYYWFLMNDLVFIQDPNPIDTMIEVLESEPRMGILSPTEPDSEYPDCRPYTKNDWHKVATTDYLALLMKDQCLQETGFLGSHFKYSWGAIHELTYRMYQKGWFIAYCDKVTMKHLGGTTYGATKNAISRKDYEKNAKMWCARYFVNTHGEDWDRKFSRYLPPEIKFNTYTSSRMIFEQANIYHLINEFLKLSKAVTKKEPFITYLEKKSPDLIRKLEKKELFYKENAKLFRKKTEGKSDDST